MASTTVDHRLVEEQSVVANTRNEHEKGKEQNTDLLDHRLPKLQNTFSSSVGSYSCSSASAEEANAKMEYNNEYSRPHLQQQPNRSGTSETRRRSTGHHSTYSARSNKSTASSMSLSVSKHDFFEAARARLVDSSAGGTANVRRSGQSGDPTSKLQFDSSSGSVNADVNRNIHGSSSSSKGMAGGGGFLGSSAGRGGENRSTASLGHNTPETAQTGSTHTGTTATTTTDNIPQTLQSRKETLEAQLTQPGSPLEQPKETVRSKLHSLHAEGGLPLLRSFDEEQQQVQPTPHHEVDQQEQASVPSANKRPPLPPKSNAEGTPQWITSMEPKNEEEEQEEGDSSLDVSQEPDDSKAENEGEGPLGNTANSTPSPENSNPYKNGNSLHDSAASFSDRSNSNHGDDRNFSASALQSPTKQQMPSSHMMAYRSRLENFINALRGGSSSSSDNSDDDGRPTQALQDDEPQNVPQPKQVESWYADYGKQGEGETSGKTPPRLSLSESSAVSASKNDNPITSSSSIPKSPTRSYNTGGSVGGGFPESSRAKQYENAEIQATLMGDISKYSNDGDSDDDDSYNIDAVEENPNYVDPGAVVDSYYKTKQNKDKTQWDASDSNNNEDSYSPVGGVGVTGPNHSSNIKQQPNSQRTINSRSSDSFYDDAGDDENQNLNQWDEENPVDQPMSDGSGYPTRETDIAKSEDRAQLRQNRTRSCQFVLACFVIVGLCCIAVGLWYVYGVKKDENSSNSEQGLNATGNGSKGPEYPSLSPTVQTSGPFPTEYWATPHPASSNNPIPSILPSKAPPPVLPPYWGNAPIDPENTYWDTAAPQVDPGNTYWDTSSPAETSPSGPAISAAEETPSPSSPSNQYWNIYTPTPTATSAASPAPSSNPHGRIPTPRPTIKAPTFPPTGPPSTAPPTTSPTASPTVAFTLISDLVPTTINNADFVILSNLSNETWQTIRNNPASPQAEALRWMMDDPNLEQYPQWRQEQRFALATLYFSLFSGDGSVGGVNMVEVARSQAKPQGSLGLRRGLQSVATRTNWLDYNSNECTWFYTSGIDTTDSLSIASSSSAGRDSIPVCNKEGHYEKLVVPVSNGANPGTVTDIYLPALPLEIAMLSELRILRIPNNKVSTMLVEFIPEQMARMTNLQELDMSQGNVVEWSSQSLARLPTSLEKLDLSYNNMKGPIMTELGMLLTSLRELFLMGNQLSGSIPASLFSWTRLEELHASANAITGSLPPEVGTLSSYLKVLSLSANSIEGSIPTTIGDLKMLDVLDLESNRLTGSLPSDIGRSNMLSYLGLAHNNLSSKIPSEVGFLSMLQNLRLANNHLSGAIPSELGLLDLTNLQLHSNSLTGSLPPLPESLVSLDIHDNFLMGTIGTFIGRLKSLNFLYLYENAFSGRLPTEVGLLQNVSYIGFENNNLGGPLRSELGLLRQLRYLQLSNNHFSSTIPTQLSSLTSLKYLFLSGNKLTGFIPSQLGLISQLKYFDLGGGNDFLTGTVPQALCALTDLSIRVRCSRIQCTCGCLC